MSKGIVREDNLDYMIFKNIEGMCVPLEKMFKDMETNKIKAENFFPYITSDKKYGYFLKQPDNTYKDLSQANWRSILHGQKLKLRPKDKLPINNRIKAYDKDTQKHIDICYWPDNYLESHSNDFKKKEKKVPTVNLGSSKILAEFTKKALISTSFEFLNNNGQKTSTIDTEKSFTTTTVKDNSISPKENTPKNGTETSFDMSFLMQGKKKRLSTNANNDTNLGNSKLLFKYIDMRESKEDGKTVKTTHKIDNKESESEPLKLWKCLIDKGLDIYSPDDKIIQEIEQIFILEEPTKKRKHTIIDKDNDEKDMAEKVDLDDDKTIKLSEKKRRRIVY